MKTKLRNIGDLVTPIAERKSDKDQKEVHHHFRKGEKLTIDREALWESEDGTKNYWCIGEDGDEDSMQVLNEKEIIDYK